MIEVLPLVSIMIPTYNRVERLKRAVGSALNQKYPRIEILISNNASIDGTDAYLNSILDVKVKSFRQENNVGLIGNWNFLAKKASGDYCLMLSDDDELDDHAIKNLVSAMATVGVSSEGGEIRVVVGSSSISKNLNEAGGESIVALSCRELMQRVLRDEVQALPSATLIRTEALKKNGYRSYYGTAIDLGLVADLAKDGGNAVITNQVVCKYNIHADNITSKFDVDEVYKTYRRLLRVAYGGEKVGVSYLCPLGVFMRKMLGYVVAERYSRNKITLHSALKYIYKYRKYFELMDFFSMLFKMLAKKVRQKLG